MIVDIHTHTPRHRHRPTNAAPPPGTVAWRPDKPAPGAYDWDDYVEVVRPVDRAICFNIAAGPGDASVGDWYMGSARQVNDETAAIVRAYPDKLIGFLSVHPFDPGALDEIERGAKDLGLRGIKLGPNYQNFDPLGEPAFLVYRRAQELGLPVLF